MTIVKRLPTAAVGPNVELLPIYLPGTGVAGVTHRWRAANVEADDTDPIPAMPDMVGAINLVQADGTKQPTLHVESGVKMVRFDGSNDGIKTAVNPTEADIKTVVMFARINSSGNSGVVSMGAGSAQHVTSVPPTYARAYWLGAANKDLRIVAPFNDALFHTWVIVGDRVGGNYNLMIDGLTASVSAAGTAPFQGNQHINLGLYNDATAGQIDVLEAFTVGAALTSGDRDAIRAAAQVNYPGLIA